MECTISDTDPVLFCTSSGFFRPSVKTRSARKASSTLATLALAGMVLILLAAGLPQAVDAQAPAVDSVVAAVTGETLIYSVHRVPERPFDVARAVSVITRDDLARKNARTLPEALMDEVGLFVQQTNYGAGAPIIRGLMGKQILILIDGVRLNNATFRFGPVQYLATIDLNIVDRIEIVRGVGSVLGSDALGGIINVITRKGEAGAGSRPLHGKLFSRYSSADRAVTGHAQLSGGTDRFRFFAGATHRRSSDVAAGGSVGVQRATGYTEGGANANVEYFLSDDKTFGASYQILQQNQVPRTDRIASGTNLVYDYDPQRLQLATLRYSDLTPRIWSEFLQVTAFWNRQDEGRREILASRPTVERVYADSDPMWGVNIEMGSSIGRSHQLVYGLDYATERVSSRRTDTDLGTGVTSPRRGQLTDGATYRSTALYLQDRFNLTSRVRSTVGLRYSAFRSDGEENTSIGLLDLRGRNAALTASANVLFLATDRLHFAASAVSGFRAPNLDDLSVFEERTQGTEVPNANLVPERALAFETGVKYSGRKLSASAFYFTRRMVNLLVREAGTFQGLPYIDRNGNKIREPTEPAVFQKQNTGDASIKGTEIDLQFRPHRELTLFGTHTFTMGEDESQQVPLARIPPIYGTAGVRWSPHAPRKPWVEVSYRFANAQRRLNPADIADTRIGPGGTDRFDVFSLRSGGLLMSRLPITVSVENLTDAVYKYHLSGIYRPGRQLVLGAEYSF